MVQKINGYHGGFENDVNEQQLNKCSENEIHMEDFYETCELILKLHGGSCETYKIAERYIKEYNNISFLYYHSPQ